MGVALGGKLAPLTEMDVGKAWGLITSERVVWVALEDSVRTMVTAVESLLGLPYRRLFVSEYFNQSESGMLTLVVVLEGLN